MKGMSHGCKVRILNQVIRILLLLFFFWLVMRWSWFGLRHWLHSRQWLYDTALTIRLCLWLWFFLYCAEYFFSWVVELLISLGGVDDAGDLAMTIIEIIEATALLQRSLAFSVQWSLPNHVSVELNCLISFLYVLSELRLYFAHLLGPAQWCIINQLFFLRSWIFHHAFLARFRAISRMFQTTSAVTASQEDLWWAAFSGRGLSDGWVVLLYRGLVVLYVGHFGN